MSDTQDHAREEGFEEQVGKPTDNTQAHSGDKPQIPDTPENRIWRKYMEREYELELEKEKYESIMPVSRLDQLAKDNKLKEIQDELNLIDQSFKTGKFLARGIAEGRAIKFKMAKKLAIAKEQERIETAFEAAALFLSGIPLAVVAESLGRGKSAIKETAHRVCKKLNPSEYERLRIKNAKRRAKKIGVAFSTNDWRGTVPLMRDLVKNKDQFLDV